LESDDPVRLGLGRTQPADVTEGEGALLGRACLKSFADDDFFRLWPEWVRLSGLLLAGTKAREERESLFDSCSKVLIASIREALERFIRAV